MNQFGSHPLAQSSMQGFSPQLSTNAKGSDAAQLLDDPDVSKYKYNHLIKPPFSYSTLICMAMKAKGSAIDGKITLTQLLNWIADNFSYYKHSDPAWQVGVSSLQHFQEEAFKIFVDARVRETFHKVHYSVQVFERIPCKCAKLAHVKIMKP